MSKKTWTVGIMAAALLSGLLPSSPAQAATTACAAATRSGLMATTFYTFTVTAKPVKKVYRVGDRMKVAMTVQRPGPYDPLGEGQPLDSPQYFPAEGVEVSASLYVGEYHYTYGLGVTDAEGKATIVVRPFPKSAPSGPVRAQVAARAFYNRGGCPDIEEVGYNAYDPFLTLIK
jgi:hypothetical protein